MEELRPLKRALLDEYGHFADRRIKDIDKSVHFIIDERDGGGPSFASDGTPFGWFCEMFADILRPDAVKIIIRGHIPMGTSVAAWLDGNSVKAERPFAHLAPSYTFTVTPTDADKLLTLADALQTLVDRRIVREKSDWFVAPRVAANLRRIRGVLKRHWEAGRCVA